MASPDVKVAYETAVAEKWAKIRPHEHPVLLSAGLSVLMADDRMRVLVQIAFEAGRDWQSKHPTASIEYPDYDAPAVDKPAP